MILFLLFLTVVSGVGAVCVTIGCERKGIWALAWALFLACGLGMVLIGIVGAWGQ